MFLRLGVFLYLLTIEIIEFLYVCRCIYINFRRNMVFLKCDHRRLIVSKASSSSLQPQPEDIDHDKNSKFAFVAH